MTEFYEKVREFVMRAITTRNKLYPDRTPSAYWIDFTKNFHYVYDLMPAELQRIRYHTYHLTSDIYLTYYFAADAYKKLLSDGYGYFIKRCGLVSLYEGDLGIGVDTEYGRISHDLLRYLGVFCDIKESRLIHDDERKVVMEIGGGYGGLARVHLTQAPSSSYIISDLEETQFFSAIYLANHFGEDRIHLMNSPLSEKILRPGHVYIVPQSRMDFLEHVSFDYAISQQSLQEMTASQVQFYLGWLSERTSNLYTCNIDSHGDLASEKHLITNLNQVMANAFGPPVWIGSEPTSDCRFGDNHLPRMVFKCRKQ